MVTPDVKEKKEILSVVISKVISKYKFLVLILNILTVMSGLKGQNSGLKADTIFVKYNHCPEFENLIGLIDHCNISISEDKIWLHPVFTERCGSIDEVFYFQVTEKEIIYPKINHIPLKIKNIFRPSNLISLPEKNIRIWSNNSTSFDIIITDTLNNYIDRKIYPRKRRKVWFVPFRSEFRISENIYFPFFKLDKYPPSNLKYNKRKDFRFGVISLNSFLNKKAIKLKYNEYINAYPCDFERTYRYFDDRQIYPDTIRNVIWFMDNYSSKISGYLPLIDSFKCYSLPCELIQNDSDFIFVNKVDSTANDPNEFIPHERGIVKIKDPDQKLVGTTLQQDFKILPNENLSYFRWTNILVMNKTLINRLDSLSGKWGFNLIHNQREDLYYRLYSIYDVIQLEPVIKHVFQIVTPFEDYIHPIEITDDRITGFKMIKNTKGMRVPSVITWHIN